MPLNYIMKKDTIHVPEKRRTLESTFEIEQGLKSTANEFFGETDDEFFLKKSIAENSQKGMELLFSRYYAPLCNHAVKFVSSKEVAEDIVSEIFYQFYLGKTYETVTTSFRAYLFRSVRNRGYNYLRQELTRKTFQFEAIDLKDLPSDPPDHLTDYEELYQDFEKAVNNLPVSRRNIYRLNHIEGMSMKEIASNLNISTKTVDVQLYRARKTIREVIRSKWFSLLLLFINW